VSRCLRTPCLVHERGGQALALGHVASWGLFGSVTYAGCQWVMLVILAKLGSAEMMGQFALGFAVAAPVFLLTNLSLKEILATDARAEHLFGDYLALRLATTLAGLLVISGIAGAIAYSWQTRAAILLVGVVKAVESVSDVLYGLMQKNERMDLIAGSIVMRGAFSVLAFAAAVYLLGSVLWGLALVSVVWALVLATYDLPAGARLLETGVRARWVRIDLVRLMRLSLPLGVTAMLISLSTMIPRYFIEHFRGEQELGAFVAMTSLTVVGGTVVNALGQAASPRLARYYATGDRASVRRVLVGVVGLAVVMGGAGVVVAMVWGRQILTALYRPEYAEHVDAFTLIMVAAGFSYVAALLGHAMTSARLFRVQMPLFAGVAAAALVACAGWVPANGLIGAAQANVVTVVANLLGVAAVHVYASRHSRLARRIERGLYRREPGPDPSRV
jgi:O-antigen/teichoic acid export membrane protein